VAGPTLGVLELVDHALPQPSAPTGPPHPDPERIELVPAAMDDLPVEAHQKAHLFR
jgi:hypothetical protein